MTIILIGYELSQQRVGSGTVLWNRAEPGGQPSACRASRPRSMISSLASLISGEYHLWQLAAHSPHLPLPADHYTFTFMWPQVDKLVIESLYINYVHI
jgi:hypothetical protein